MGTILGIGLFLHAGTVHAQNVFLTPNNAGAQLGISDIVQKITVINTLMHVVILIVLNFVQYLLQADFFTNPQMMSALNNIWRLSRDLMNVGFAVMLIGVALYTIVTANKKFVTEKLMTFVIAVLFVNFSWFYPRVNIDVANILTATIYSIPQIMGNFGCQTFNPAGGTMPCKVVTDINLFGDGPQQTAFCAGLTAPDCACVSGIACYKLDTYQNVMATGNMGVGHVMINGLVVNFAKILELTQVPASIAGGVPATSGRAFVVNLQIIMIIAITFLIQAAVVLPLIGLVAGLLARIVIIWVTTAFMPFTFLGLVVNGKLGTNVFGFEFDIWDDFLNAAFLPAMVALPLTIGFVMLTTVAQVPAPSASFPMSWNIPLVAGFTSWWPLLWIVAAVGILWTGAFKALEKNKYISGFTGKLKGIGEGLFSAGLQAPLLLPLPMPGGKSMNIGGALHFPSRVGDAIRSSARTGIPFSQALGTATNTTNPQNPLNQATINAAAQALSKGTQQSQQQTQAIVKAINDLKTNPTDTTILKRKEVLDAIGSMHANASQKDILLRIQGIANTGQVGDLTTIKTQIKELVDKEK
jgi:hypothetical protein